MDISPKYIQMCEQAKELQSAWTPKVGDYVWKKYTVFGEEIDKEIWGDKLSEIILLTFKSSAVGYFHATDESGHSRTVTFNSQEEMYKEICVWIPRQDQLQEIISAGLKSPLLVNMIRGLYNWYDEGKQRYLGTSVSMEQLLLVYVMECKYDKFWSNENQKWTQKT